VTVHSPARRVDSHANTDTQTHPPARWGIFGNSSDDYQASTYRMMLPAHQQCEYKPVCRVWTLHNSHVVWLWWLLLISLRSHVISVICDSAVIYNNSTDGLTSR